MWNLACIFDRSRLWVVLVSKRINILKSRINPGAPMIYVLPTFSLVQSTQLLKTVGSLKPSEKRAGKICWIISNSARHCQVLLKFGTWVRCGPGEAAVLWKSTLWTELWTNWKWYNRKSQPQIVLLCWNLVVWCIMGLVIKAENDYGKDRLKRQCSANCYSPSFLIINVLV